MFIVLLHILLMLYLLNKYSSHLANSIGSYPYNWTQKKIQKITQLSKKFIYILFIFITLFVREKLNEKAMTGVPPPSSWIYFRNGKKTSPFLPSLSTVQKKILPDYKQKVQTKKIFVVYNGWKCKYLQ